MPSLPGTPIDEDDDLTGRPEGSACKGTNVPKLDRSLWENTPTAQTPQPTQDIVSDTNKYITMAMPIEPALDGASTAGIPGLGMLSAVLSQDPPNGETEVNGTTRPLATTNSSTEARNDSERQDALLTDQSHQDAESSLSTPAVAQDTVDACGASSNSMLRDGSGSVHSSHEHAQQDLLGGMVCDEHPAAAEANYPLDATPGEDVKIAMEASVTAQEQDVSVNGEHVENAETQVESETNIVAPDATNGVMTPADNHKNGHAKLLNENVDEGFLTMAEANRGNEQAEWQLDSDPETSSSDSSSDTSSSGDDNNGEDDYELLDPATAVQMLMREEEGGGPKNENTQLRTTNEKPEEIVPKPDITVTPDMEIVSLGLVENVVDNVILIKATTSGEYQVLESGSVLCLENRQVIGAVMETLGRVQEPRYSVAFTNTLEILDYGIEKGRPIFYVAAHSTFVLTQPLKQFKGTDASNIHDEEIDANDLEFSDDEAEAEYKRHQKEKKRYTKDGRDETFAVPKRKYAAPVDTISEGQSYTGGAIQYDDEEEIYTPLTRPDNLLSMAPSGPPVLREEQVQRGFSDRGRGRDGRGRGDGDHGRGRGRGDRGRGDRGRGDRGGVSRGRGDVRGCDNDRRHDRNHRPAFSYPDRHNEQRRSNEHGPPGLPLKPAPPQNWSPAETSHPLHRQFPPQQFDQYSSDQYPLHAHQQPYHPPHNAYQQQQQYPTPAPYPPPPLHQPNGYPPYSASQGSPYTGPIHPYQYSQVPAPTSDNNFPPGALVNPAFFNNSQHQQTQWPPHQPNSGWAAPPQPQTQWTPPQQYQQPVAGRWNAPQERRYGHQGGVQQSPQASNAFRAAQQQLDILRRLSSGSP
ncbi:hypothetical protein LTR50_006460 [Elasticomyces elasticus]|nr:hypothetical protein LTR50_006460 [Elasticomyces elasticus]